MALKSKTKNEKEGQLTSASRTSMPSKHKFKIQRALSYSKQQRIHQLCDSMDNQRIADPKSRQRFLPPSTLANFRSMARTILGVQEPIIRLRSGLSSNSSSSGVFNPVVSISWFGSNYYQYWAELFDEYQIIYARVHAFPAYNNNSTDGLNRYYVGVIDYDDSSPLSSISGSLLYDTSKVVSGVQSTPQPETWEVRPVGIPDLTWTATSTDRTVAYWKAYNFAGIGGSVAICQLYYEYQVRLRQSVGN